MTSFGYTLMTEQRGPRDLVSDAVGAERSGFDFAWLTEMGDFARTTVLSALREENGEPKDTAITLRHREER